MKTPETRNFPKKTLHELDKQGGGREIKGLDSQLENFSKLQIGEDIVIEKKNTKIISNQNLEDMYIFVNPNEGDIKATVHAPHWRTASHDVIHASWNSDEGNNFYYTANVKGVGYLKPSAMSQNLDDWDQWNRIDEHGEEDAFGLGCKVDFIAQDTDVITKSKWLTRNGLRTELYASYGKLKNLYFQGEKRSIQELREQGIIPNQKKFVPYIGLRLLKINTRIAEVKESAPDKASELFQHAFNIFNQEIHDKGLLIEPITFGDPESEQRFFTIFAERMGKNLAVLQNLGMIGWYIHSANVTMAAEIVDIGPYLEWSEYKPEDKEFIEMIHGIRRGTWKDLRDIAYDLKFLLDAGSQIGMSVPGSYEFTQHFTKSFSENLDDTMLAESKLSRVDLEKYAEKIFNAVIVENRRLAPLRADSHPDDWNLNN